MDKSSLKDWRKRLGKTQVAAAAAIGVSPRQYRSYETGEAAIPQPVALACVALALGYTEFRDVTGCGKPGAPRAADD